MDDIYILSPGLDQAETLADIARTAVPGRPVIGVLLDGERARSSRHYAALEPFRDADFARAVPTGARSTEMLLRRGDIRLGSITMDSAISLGFYDKPWSIAAAAAAGIPAPQTWLHRHEIPAFPAFYKSAGEGGGIRGIAHSAADLPDRDDLIFQEVIDSPGTYGLAFVADGGRILAAHAHHEVESYPAIGGSAVLIARLHDPRPLEHARRLVAHTGFSGWGLVEFKFSPRHDDYVFMELNAKFWASTEFSFRNEPGFGRLLFGLDSYRRPVERMVFVHRALDRGARFMVSRFPALAKGAELRFLPGRWQRSLLRAMIPAPARDALRRLRGRS